MAVRGRDPRSVGSILERRILRIERPGPHPVLEAIAAEVVDEWFTADLAAHVIGAVVPARRPRRSGELAAVRQRSLRMEIFRSRLPVRAGLATRRLARVAFVTVTGQFAFV